MEYLPTYLQYKNNNLYYKKINIMDLVKKYGDSLEVVCPEQIKSQIITLKTLFNEKIKKYNYSGKYYYAYASKANYTSIVLNETTKYADRLETSSLQDLKLVEYLYKENKIKKGFTIICNGFLTKEYFEQIDKLINKGLNVIPVVENKEELLYLIKQNKEYTIGVRFNIDKQRKKFFKEDLPSRFGFLYEDFLDLSDRLAKSKLKFKVFHFHLNGSISKIKDYLDFFEYVFINNYIPLKKKFNDLEEFDFGGGFPVPYIKGTKFDYDKLVDGMIKKINYACKVSHIPNPSLVGEHGRYTVADHTFHIMKVDFEKTIDKNHSWYVLNNSIGSLLPNSWIEKDPFLVLPINNIDKEYYDVRLAGATCDPADVYYMQEGKNYLSLPQSKNLYIGFFKTGAYERMLAGNNTAHHCLLKEPCRILIKDGKVKVLKKEQNFNEILISLGYKR